MSWLLLTKCVITIVYCKQSVLQTSLLLPTKCVRKELVIDIFCHCYLPAMRNCAFLINAWPASMNGNKEQRHLHATHGEATFKINQQAADL